MRLAPKPLIPPTSTPYPSRLQHTRYEIRDIDGEIVAIKERVDYPDGSKRTPWYLPGHEESGLGGLKVNSLPLFLTETLRDAPPDKPVIIVEGEKSAACLAEAGYLALGTFGASHRPNKTPLKVLKGHPVTLWPDADEPGMTHMLKLGYDVKEITDPVYLIEPDVAWPKGYDAADFLAEGYELESLRKRIKVAPARPIEINPDLNKKVLPKITGDWYRDTKERLSIYKFVSERTPLRASGSNYVGSCILPWHEDSTPSMMVYPESESWYCFGCMTGGDLIDLAWKLGIDLDKER